jgi:hypothetical protein
MNTVTKQYPETEPTLHDVINVMQSGFLRIDERFEIIDARFEKIDLRFEGIDKRFDDMDGRFDLLTTNVRDIQQRMGRLELGMEEIADTVLNHEERMVKLELHQ